jgi:hypothetical protein
VRAFVSPVFAVDRRAERGVAAAAGSADIS